MPDVTSYPTGAFCWAELGTSDIDAAKAFYTRVFAWNLNEIPIGPGQVYVMLRKGQLEAAALYGLNEDQRAQGTPPHWMVYINVADADASARRIQELGGAIIMPPFDVLDVGRMSVARDPQGAVFALWQARAHKGAGVLNEPGAMCWHELMTTDVAAAKRFYGSLFGWTPQDMPMGPMIYTVFGADGAQRGGMLAITPEMGEVPPNWMVYFAVSNCDAFVSDAASNGGGAIVPATDIPNVGRFAVVRDPQGAAFGILQPQQS